MHYKSLLIKPSLAAALSLALFACSSDTTVETLAAEVSEETSQTLSEDSEEAIIYFTVGTSTSSGVVYSKSVAQAREDTEIQTEYEKDIKSVHLYIFIEGDEEIEDDSDYYFLSSYHFDESSEATDEQSALTTLNENVGTKQCWIKLSIPADMVNKQVKFAIIANDQPDEPTVGETSLADFKVVLATASVSSGDPADNLVGGEIYSSSTTGYPMSAVAVDEDEAEEITLDGIDISLSANLQRTMARLDIFNFTPNLTITDVKMYNVIDKSYLFSQGDEVTANPDESSFISLEALTYFTDSSQGNEYILPFTFVDPADDESNTSIAFTEEDYRELNTLEGIFYMYEQYVDSKHVPYVVIEYEYDYGTGDDDAVVSGSVKVEFKDTSDNYVNIERNNRYRIRFGDGSGLDGIIRCGFEIDDWYYYNTDSTTEIDISVDISEDNSTEE